MTIIERQEKYIHVELVLPPNFLIKKTEVTTVNTNRDLTYLDTS